MASALIRLHVDRSPNDKRPAYHATPIKRAQPLWRARSGFLIHRPRTGRLYLGQNGRVSFTWYCGNSALYPIPVKPECMEGLEMCVVCDAKWQKSQPVEVREVQ